MTEVADYFRAAERVRARLAGRGAAYSTLERCRAPRPWSPPPSAAWRCSFAATRLTPRRDHVAMARRYCRGARPGRAAEQAQSRARSRVPRVESGESVRRSAPRVLDSRCPGSDGPGGYPHEMTSERGSGAPGALRRASSCTAGDRLISWSHRRRFERGLELAGDLRRTTHPRLRLRGWNVPLRSCEGQGRAGARGSARNRSVRRRRLQPQVCCTSVGSTLSMSLHCGESGGNGNRPMPFSARRSSSTWSIPCRSSLTSHGCCGPAAD